MAQSRKKPTLDNTAFGSVAFNVSARVLESANPAQNDQVYQESE